jgi:hypothetical protein
MTDGVLIVLRKTSAAAGCPVSVITLPLLTFEELT